MRTNYAIFAGITASMVLAVMAVAAEPAAPPPAVDPAKQTVCRKDLETGSLVRSKRTCHTKAQWTYIDDENQRFSRKLVEDSTSKPGGN